MNGKTYASITLDVEVHDLDQLRKAAAFRAEGEGICEQDWNDMRRGPEDDIVMLLDPGYIEGAGISIVESGCTLA